MDYKMYLNNQKNRKKRNRETKTEDIYKPEQKTSKMVLI